MSGVYKITEMVGCSNKSFADAAQNAVKRASKTLRDLKWFEVTNMRGKIKEGQVAEFQVTMKLGFRIEE